MCADTRPLNKHPYLSSLADMLGLCTLATGCADTKCILFAVDSLKKPVGGDNERRVW